MAKSIIIHARATGFSISKIRINLWVDLKTIGQLDMALFIYIKRGKDSWVYGKTIKY
jgi:hypothetical protein